jgi:hypothetical protein
VSATPVGTAPSATSSATGPRAGSKPRPDVAAAATSSRGSNDDLAHLATVGLGAAPDGEPAHPVGERVRDEAVHEEAVGECAGGPAGSGAAG